MEELRYRSRVAERNREELAPEDNIAEEEKSGVAYMQRFVWKSIYDKKGKKTEK